MTPEDVQTQAKNHANNLLAAQNQLDTKKVHPASPEGNVFQIILDAVDFLLKIFHHSQTATPAAVAGAETTTTLPGALETEKE